MERPRPQTDRDQEWKTVNEEFDIAFKILEDEERRGLKLKRIVENLMMRLTLYLNMKRQRPGDVTLEQIQTITNRLAAFNALLMKAREEYEHWHKQTHELMERIDQMEKNETTR